MILYFKNSIWCVMCIFSLSLSAQSFEGTITYINDFDVSQKFKDMGLTKEVMQAELKKKDNWFDTAFVSYKQGDYAFLTNVILKKIYKAAENKIYTFADPENELCEVREAVDVNLKGETDNPQITELDSTATIMGFPCKIIRMKWQLGQYDYYYNTDQAKVDPALFSKHTYEGFSEFVSRTKCLPLQIVKKAMGITVSQTAISVKSHAVKADVFSLPQLKDDKSLNELKMPKTKIMRIKK